MRIKNVSNSSIIMSDLPGAQPGQGLTLQAQAEATIFDEDAEKSSQLASFMSSGFITKLSAAEPGDGGATSDTDETELKSLNEFADYYNVHIKDFLEDVRSLALSNDVGFQFAGGVNGKNGMITANNYTGAVNANVAVPLEVTDGDGTKNILNSVSFVTVSISGGTATGKTIDGVAGPVVKPIVRGATQVLVKATGAGTVTLALSAPMHPSETLNVADTAVVTLS